jgi:membrane-associated phospholipid phosphatase
MSYSRFITDFGDQAVVFPMAVGIALVFALSRWRRGALGWTVAIGATLGLVLLLKIVCLACGHLVPEARLNSPSGHTAAAAAVYGGLAGIVMRSLWNDKYWLAGTFTVALLCAVVFGATRLMLGAHSIPEVIVGGTIGVGGAIASTALAGVPSPAVRMSRVAVMGLTILFLLHGFHLPAEAAIRSAAFRLWPFSECP